MNVDPKLNELIVYEQIEHLSKAPKVRRSKSLTKTEKSLRTSSPHQDHPVVKDLSARSRISSEASTIVTSSGPTPSSRSSFEKTRAMKIFNSRSSLDRDGEIPNSHKRSDSMISQNSKHTLTQNDECSTYEVSVDAVNLDNRLIIFAGRCDATRIR